MNKEAIYEQQKIDCNCNDCGFLVRDLAQYKLSEIFHNKLNDEEFRRNLNTDLFYAYTFRDKVNILKALKQNPRFKKPTTQYGYCKRFEFKKVSFIPGTCQLHTQDCFTHRKDIYVDSVSSAVKN